MTKAELQAEVERLQKREQEAEEIIARSLPSLGGHARGFAQEVLALACLFVEANPYDWTSYPDTLTRRIELLPKRTQRKLERRRNA